MNKLLAALLSVLCLPALGQVIVLPGQDFNLEAVEGIGHGNIHLYPTFPAPMDGSILVLMAWRDGSGYGRGYVQELVGDRVALEMIWGFPVHVAYPQTLEMDRWYYMRSVDAAGVTRLRTEPFLMDGPAINPLLPGSPVIPEVPSALWAALGLLTFPLFNRHKPNQKA